MFLSEWPSWLLRYILWDRKSRFIVILQTPSITVLGVTQRSRVDKSVYRRMKALRERKNQRLQSYSVINGKNQYYLMIPHRGKGNILLSMKRNVETRSSTAQYPFTYLGNKKEAWQTRNTISKIWWNSSNLKMKLVIPVISLCGYCVVH